MIRSERPAIPSAARRLFVLIAALLSTPGALGASAPDAADSAPTEAKDSDAAAVEGAPATTDAPTSEPAPSPEAQGALDVLNEAVDAAEGKADGADAAAGGEDGGRSSDGPTVDGVLDRVLDVFTPGQNSGVVIQAPIPSLPSPSSSSRLI